MFKSLRLTFILILALMGVGFQSVQIVAEQNQHVPSTNEKAPSLKNKIKHIICKNKKTLSACALIGGFVLLIYFLPTANRIANIQIGNREHLIGNSLCNVREIVLVPDQYQETWNHRLVDGNGGRYAWRHNQTGERVFAVLNDPYDVKGRTIVRFENEDGEQRFVAGEVVHMQRLFNVINVQFRLNRILPIRQLEVFRQQGDTCAYHAFKNCRLILFELLQPQGNLQQQLQSNEIVNEFIGDRGNYLGRWPTHILQNHPNLCAIRDGQRAGDWLHCEGLQQLINFEHDEQHVSLVSSGRFQERLAQNPLVLPRVINEQDHENIVHGFLIQDRDHWLTAVMRKVRGNIEWLIADSNNMAAFNRAGLIHLLANLYGQR